MSIGENIKQKRLDQKLTLPELARISHVSKGYLSEMESGAADRPSAATLYRIANALGTTVAELLEPGSSGAAQSGTDDLAPGLKEFAEQRKLPDADVRMLAGISYRGRQPVTVEDWSYIYDSIRMRVENQPRK